MELSVPTAAPVARLRWRRLALRAVVVIGVFALALLVRLQAVAALDTDYDEDDYLRAGQLYAQHLAAGDLAGVMNERANYEHPPLTKLAYGAILLGYGPQAYAEPVEALPSDQLPRPGTAAQVREFAQPLRGFSALVGGLTAGVLAIVSPPAGILLALSSWHVKYTSQAMLEALPCLFATICLLLLSRSRRNGDLRFWLAALALGLTAAGTYRYAAGGFAAFGWIAWRARVSRSADEQPWRWLVLPFLWGGLALLVFYTADPALWPDPIGRLRESILFNADYSTGESVAEAGFPWFQPLFWLIGALPWNPGPAPLRLDGFFALAGMLALPKLWRAGGGQRLVALWFLANLIFLFFWPTKWPQYVLALLPAIFLAAAESMRTWPGWLRDRLRFSPVERREMRGAAFWLWPAGLLLLAVAAYPLILQIGMAMSYFQAQNIRAGQLAFWEALLRGALTLPAMERNPLNYFGLGPLSQMSWIVFPLRFNLIWVGTVLTLATVLGLRLAVLLQRIGLRSRAVWRTLFILPWAIPEFVGALVWNTIFDETSAR
ncbi:MAG: hypothetical protein HC822_02660 [Oscillochloris sp.]|nr:hypothetical protein [Oscillochloris sp.]